MEKCTVCAWAENIFIDVPERVYSTSVIYCITAVNVWDLGMFITGTHVCDSKTGPS